MLRDRYGRSIEYLRLSVTDRCDLRCTYCIPKGFKGFEEPAHWLTFDQIERLVAAFARLGTARVRLTGGEPLLRRGLAGLAARLSAIPGIDDLSLSTNATRMTRHAAELRAAGELEWSRAVADASHVQAKKGAPRRARARLIEPETAPSITSWSTRPGSRSPGLLRAATVTTSRS